MNEGDKTIPNCLRITKKCFAVVTYFLSNCELILPKFQGFNGILNYVPCFSAAVLYQLSFEDRIYREIIVVNLKIRFNICRREFFLLNLVKLDIQKIRFGEKINEFFCSFYRLESSSSSLKFLKIYSVLTSHVICHVAIFLKILNN